jgi:hypothetical protein
MVRILFRLLNSARATAAGFFFFVGILAPVNYTVTGGSARRPLRVIESPGVPTVTGLSP